MRLPISEHAFWKNPSTVKLATQRGMGTAIRTHQEEPHMHAWKSEASITRPEKAHNLYETDALRIVAREAIAVDQEIYLDYGNDYKIN